VAQLSMNFVFAQLPQARPSSDGLARLENCGYLERTQELRPAPRVANRPKNGLNCQHEYRPCSLSREAFLCRGCALSRVGSLRRVPSTWLSPGFPNTWIPSVKNSDMRECAGNLRAAQGPGEHDER
jgi:hypothetical protein